MNGINTHNYEKENDSPFPTLERMKSRINTKNHIIEIKAKVIIFKKNFVIVKLY